jgi:HEAT repeat protein
MEPRLMASGNLCFVRQDNFMQRAKVETHLHMIRPDGTAGHILLGPDRGPLALDRMRAAEEDGLWLRSYGVGSPAPLPDGRVAAISSHGLLLSGNQTAPAASIQPSIEVVDISPLPDSRLLCTIAGQSALGILNPADGRIVRLYSQPEGDLHSVTYLGPRPFPPGVRDSILPEAEDDPGATGFLLCQDVRFTRQIQAETSRIKAVRVLEGRPFALRSAKHQYAHIGVEAVELGTVPVAPDGSFYIEVPADRALSLQAVDAEGRTVINELSWIYVRPGEVRSCSGCHSPREQAPPSDGIIQALMGSPVPLLGKGEPHRFRGNNAANGGVLNLQFDRMRETASINLHSLSQNGAAERLEDARRARADDLEKLAAHLAEGPLAQKVGAAQRLALFREPSTTAALMAALRDPNASVRMNAALALAAGGGKTAKEALLEALDDPEPVVAQAAHVALTALTAAEVPFNPFTRQRNSRAEQTSNWKRFFEKRDWAAIEERLIAQLHRRSSGGFKTSDSLEDLFNALGRIGGEPAKQALLEWLKTDPEDDLRVTLAVLRALGQLEVQEAIPHLAVLLRVNLPKPDKPLPGHHEFGWTQRPVQIAAGAMQALGRIGGPQAEAALIESAQHLVEFWHYTYQTADHDWLMGCHASPPHFRLIEALDAIGSTQIAPLIPMVLKSTPIDPDRGLFFENDTYEILTARVVHRSGLAAEILDAAFDALENGSEAESSGPWHDAVTASPPAVTVLPFDAPMRAAQLISILAQSSEDAPRIRAAFERYGQLPPDRSRNWILFYLARSLGKLQDGGSFDLLVSALVNDPAEGSFGRVDPPHVYLFHAVSPYYRAAAAHALGEIGDPRGAPVLLMILSNFDNAMDVRHAAAQALLQLKDLKTYPDLERLARDYPEIATRRLLLAACEAIGSLKKSGSFALEKPRPPEPHD